MRPRFVVLASLVAALVAVAVPATATAAPHRNHGLTINATPNPDVSGDPVLIYGQLNLPHPANRLIRLYHRINPASSFTLIQTTLTTNTGFYEFTRADGVVTTNRSWYVLGPNSTHSRTVHEKVSALLKLTASSDTGTTGAPITFSGTISPAAVHAGERVFLQKLNGDSGDDWNRIGSGVIGADGTFSIIHRFAVPDGYEVRVVFHGDARNIASVSDPVDVTIQQAENPSFTINSSSPTINDGQMVKISGTLFMPGSTTAGEPMTPVTLWAKPVGGKFMAIASTVTGTDGGYSFDQAPIHNTIYQVRTTLTPKRVTSQLFEGVHDVVSISDGGVSNAFVGQKVQFTGGVTPDKAGHVIYLERLGPDGDYHIVKVGRVTGGSTYAFTWTFGAPGVHTFRVRIPGGKANLGGTSSPVAINVEIPPVSSLPPAS